MSRDPIPPRNSVQPRNQGPPLAGELDILDRFAVAARGCGLVGEIATAQLLYLALTSRLLDHPVSVGVKGHSSSGKSFVVETVCRFFPKEAVLEMTAMSPHALVYLDEGFEHRVLVVYEVVALREGVEDDPTAYFVRSLLSEGHIKYAATQYDPKAKRWVTKTIEKKGPTGLVFTTTKARVHGENETRVLSVTTDDSRAQTARVLEALAGEGAEPDLDKWRELQSWLKGEEHRVVIPYAKALADLVPPVAVRLRRDFAAVLALVRAHAILHQLTRAFDADTRVVASLEDYEVVARLIGPLVAEGVGATVSKVTRETVETVASMATPEGVTAQALAHRLRLDKSTVVRRLSVAGSGGWLDNLEDRRGRPGRWVVGEPLPDEVEVLPSVARLREALKASATTSDGEGPGQAAEDPSGCTVAADSGGVGDLLERWYGDDPPEEDRA